MNLTLDIGNTRIKWAAFQESSLLQTGVLSASEKLRDEWAALQTDYPGAQVLAAVSGRVPDVLSGLPMLTATTPLPVKVDYQSRQTLGADRIAAAVGASSLLPVATSALIIDAGTCITVDYLSVEGVFCGGAILPGLSMQFGALHEKTAALPLLTLDQCGDWDGRAVGKTTVESIQAGVLTATRYAVGRFVAHHRQTDSWLQVFVTGGDARWVMPPDAQILPHLSLIGLNVIINFNKKITTPNP